MPGPLFARGSSGLALFDPAEDVQTIVDPKDAAQSAGLRHVSDHRPAIRRKKSGKGFTYVGPDGTKLCDSQVRGRERVTR
jgi:DNA topoisomerase-1